MDCLFKDCREGRYTRNGRRLCFDCYVQPAWAKLFQIHLAARRRDQWVATYQHLMQKRRGQR
jgi:hypothetical protein